MTKLAVLIPAKAIEEILFYLWRDEQKHFDQMKLDGEDTSTHIFNHLKTVNRWLERTTGRSIDDISFEFQLEYEKETRAFVSRYYGAEGN